MQSEAPEISVIVPVRQAERTISSTLTSLSAQCASCNAEVIAVVSESDPSRNVVEKFRAPGVRVLVQPPDRGVPQLRRDGVDAARAPYLVITEDHCTFPDGWLKHLLETVRKTKAGAAGGPVLNGRRTYAGWAQYFTRYTAFLLENKTGAVHALPGNNAIYLRNAVERHRRLLQDGFWEAEFNHALLADGHSFWMTPELAIEQHQFRGALAYIPLRFRHGRCYGWRRLKQVGSRARLRLLAATPLVPLILYYRATRNVFGNRRHIGMFLLTTPLLLCYYAAWSAGEAMGYISGPGDRWWDTD